MTPDSKKQVISPSTNQIGLDSQKILMSGSDFSRKKK